MAMQSEQLGFSCNNLASLRHVPRWDEPMKVDTDAIPEDMSTTYAMLALAEENARLTNEIMNMQAAFAPFWGNPGYMDFDAGYDAGYMNFGVQSQFGLYDEPSFVHASLASSAKSVRRKNSTRKTQASNKAQGVEGGKCVDATSDVSTAVGSSPPVSIVTSRNHSRVPSTDGDSAERPEQLDARKTTVMMRHLPNDYTRDMVLELLKNKGYEDKFDFIYLPIDFQRKAGLGYAFINFVDPETAAKFQEEFTGFTGWAVTSDKICEVAWSAVQGLETHIDRYRNNPVMHESVPEEYRPRLYVDSQMVPFPLPTKSIRAPRHWNRRQRDKNL
jgi:hypothetical protein